MVADIRTWQEAGDRLFCKQQLQDLALAALKMSETHIGCHMVEGVGRNNQPLQREMSTKAILTAHPN